MLIEKIIEAKKADIKQWPCNSNRASEMGHPCLRYLVFLRTRWQEKALHSVDLQFIFDEGRMHEDAVMDTLRQAGFTLIEQQRAFDWPKYQITGHLDAKVLIEGRALPLEIKSSSPYVFNSINTVEDLLKGKYVYLQKYPAQLTLYMLMGNTDEALFLFKNKVNGQLKELYMKLNYDYGETLIQKAEAINRHVADGTIPGPIAWDENICSGCGFGHLCCNEVKRTALEITDMPDVEAKLKRLDELKPLIKEYDVLDKEIKAIFSKEKDACIVGNYYVHGIWVERKAYTVPEKKYWKTMIESLERKEINNE